MAHISIMRFDVESQSYKVFKSFNSEIIPRIGEKIVIQENDSTEIVNVFDIHYNLGATGIDLYVNELGDYDEYKLSLV